jgi:2'-5' RNA ligase
VVHVPVAGVDSLAATVVAQTAALGKPPEDRPFRGHLTLARARDRRGVELRPVSGEPVEGAWWVEEIHVIESHLHPDGARYETLARLATARG